MRTPSGQRNILITGSLRDCGIYEGGTPSGTKPFENHEVTEFLIGLRRPAGERRQRPDRVKTPIQKLEGRGKDTDDVCPLVVDQDRLSIEFCFAETPFPQ